MRPSLLAGLVVLFPVALRAQANNGGPPPTPVRVVTDTVSGIVVTDPYRWLENTQDSAVVRWLHAQDDYTRHLIARIPARADLATRIHALSNASPSVSTANFGGNRIFYFKRMPGEEVNKLYMRDSLTAPERLLVDPGKLETAGGPHWAIDYYSPSWDGRYVAYGASPAGSENSIMRIIDVSTGKLLPDSIDRAQFGGPVWRADASAFFYNRLQKLAPDAPVSEKYRNSRVYLHTLGQSDASDVPLVGIGVTKRIPLEPDDIPFMQTIPGTTWAFVLVAHGVQNELTAYVAPAADVHDSTTAWRPLMTAADSIVFFDVHGDDIYLLSHQHAPRYQVLRTNLRTPDVAHAAVVFAESPAVVQFFGAARDGLYIKTLDGGLGRLFRLAWGTTTAKPVALPYEGAINSFATFLWRDGPLFSLESWTHSPLWFGVDQKSGRLMDTGLRSPSPVDFAAITSEEVRVKAPDGTMVPLSIVHRRDAKRDGNNPTYLDGYGSYGYSYDPYFDPALLAWFEQGGVFAVCHVRGGGEFGEAWHRAGKGPTKYNTWRDLIACGDYLVAQKWTSPAHLAASGTSAGGIEIGMAVTERPDLFGAAIPRVGTLNPLREMLVGVSGPANRPEFGDPTTAEGARELLAMDTYQHVKPGTAYPAMLFTSGFNDPRVDTWIPAKTAARFQAATTSKKPVLLRVEFDAGHGFGSSMSQRENEFADIWSFLLWQFGAPKFQPAVP
ncbi:MAG TPA: prolyl oligopeptidase family serine peptidase [Gemmatimonadales bacterium]|nr:prolyl oligopeptidase family serine peptidase [Gemmatimonadales bacterium]